MCSFRSFSSRINAFRKTQSNNGRLVHCRPTIFAAVTFAVLALAANPRAASAQVYRGEAYGSNFGINATLVGVGARIVQNPSLPTAGSGTLLTNQLLNASVQAQSGNPLAPLFTALTADTINTSTIGAGGTATSVSQIEGLNLLPNLTLNVAGIGVLNLNSLVQASVIRSTTTATTVGNAGHTEIANLSFGTMSLGNIDVADASSTTYYMNLLGNVSTTASGNALVPDVAKLVINGQSTSDGGSTRTTNALAVSVLQGNSLAQGDVIVASSTAGLTAVVPEASTTTLLGFALPLIGTVVVARRRTKSGSD